MDNYIILSFIGEGSFGRVFKAKHKETNAIVALKVIRKKGRSSKDLKNLRQECDIQTKLKHPNIILMIDSFETDSELVVVTEYAEKELHSVLAKEGCLGEEQAKKITWDLVSALYYLHSHRVLHRDLKPQNVLIDGSGNAKLCDFGLARNMTNATHVLTSIKGTPLYMAPELIDEKPYDHQADLWSLGCIVYELMAGQPPFCTMSIMQLVKMIRHKPVQWPSFISVDAFSFLQGLLHKDPSNRMTWPDILKHPFVAGHVLILPEDVQSDSPFTRPLTDSQLEAKKLQRDRLNSNMRPQLQAAKAEKREEPESRVVGGAECVPMSDDDSVRATSAFSVRDSLKTDDETEPFTAQHARLLAHEYNLNTNNDKLNDDKMEKIDEEKTETKHDKTKSDNTTVIDAQKETNKKCETASQSLENPKSSTKTDSEVSAGLSKSVPPSYTQKFLQFSRDKLRFASGGNRLTRSFKRSFHFSRSLDKNKPDGQRRISEPALDVLHKGEGDEIEKFSKEERDEDIEKCEIIDETNNDKIDNDEIKKCDNETEVIEKSEVNEPSAIEQEEWEAFLNSNISEVMDGDAECLTQLNMVSMVVGAVGGWGRGAGRVCGAAAALLALPAVSPSVPRHTLLNIQDVYLEAKVIHNFVYAVATLMKNFKTSDPGSQERLVGACRLLEVCAWLCARSCRAVRQLAAALSAHASAPPVFAHLLTLGVEAPRMVLNVVSLLITILQELPEHADVVEVILFQHNQGAFMKLVQQPSDALRMRVCILISLLCTFCCTSLSTAMQGRWSKEDRDCLEGLQTHCNVTLNRAARLASKELSNMPFYT